MENLTYPLKNLLKDVNNNIMKIVISILVLSLIIGIVNPYAEVYLQDRNKKSCDMESSCDNESGNHQPPFCPLCPSIYSFTPYLPNGDETFFTDSVSLFITPYLETLTDQGYIKSVFRPPTSII